MFRPRVDIFISHCPEDERVASAIAGGLEDVGFSVAREASQAAAAGCVVVCFSEHCLQSREVLSQIRAARDKLLPVRIGALPPLPQLQAEIGNVLIRDLLPWVDGQNSRAWHTFVSDCRARLNRPANGPNPPAPLPPGLREAAAAAPWPMISIELLLPRSSLRCSDARHLTVSIPYRLRNQGGAPAKAVQWNATLYPLMSRYVRKDTGERLEPRGYTTPQAQLLDLCKGLSDVDSPLRNIGKQLFPSGVLEEDHEHLQNIDRFRGPGVEGTNGEVLPLIFTCVSYLSGFDNSFHQTGRAFALFVRDTTQGVGRRYLRLSDLPVAAAELVIEPYEPAGSVTT
jgi:hypothetical protein